VVLFLNAIRREAARSTLAEIAGVLAVSRGKSRRQHLRNGMAGLLSASSELAWRPTAVVRARRRAAGAATTGAVPEAGDVRVSVPA
jgi:hypothetical protein